MPTITWLFLSLASLAARERFPCLPNGIRAADTASAERTGQKLRVVTVEQTLKKLGAKCRATRLVDRTGREIRFYRVQCFGAPTEYALETTRRQAAELKVLREKYSVVEMTCSTTGEPRG